MADRDLATLAGKSNITKLTGSDNYRTWAKDIEMVLLRMNCWEVTSEEPPEEENRTATWIKKNNWARSEIHLACTPEQQEIILDATTAYEQFQLLKNTHATKSELKTRRLWKEFNGTTMGDKPVSTFVKRVKKVVSELRSYGEKVKDEDIAYTMLMGLPEKYSSLVITLTNMTTKESPLVLVRVIESMQTEEMRLKLFMPSKETKNVDNPLALKHDTQFKGELQSAYVARTNMPQYRQHPYNRGGYTSYRGNTNNNRGNYQAYSRNFQQQREHTTDNVQSVQNSQLKVNTSVGNVGSYQQGGNPNYGKQCYGCGGWNHVVSSCWQVRPELHPRNRQGHAVPPQLRIQDVTNEARVAGEKKEQANVMIDDHPFELNMIVCESMNSTSEMDKIDSAYTRRWLLDSGASSHYVKYIDAFRTFTWLKEPVKVYTGKGPIYGYARGEVVITMAIGKVVIKDVVLLPDLDVDANLLSVVALMKNGFGVTFKEMAAEIHKDGTIWGIAKPLRGIELSGLLYLEEFDEVENYALAFQCTDKQTAAIWHKRLGHLNGRTIKSMINKVTGLEIGEPSTEVGKRNVDCVDCLRGSQHQIISRYPFSPASRKLERVSCDLAGPMKVLDCTWSYKYFLCIVDHFTRYTWVFPLISKEMTIKAFRVFKNAAENAAGCRILTL
ncbi:MAG: uncharacterized protein JWM47_4452, partial [Acidimicrobiales bacterium]|nr:uncharacterized protein [Acidimicrobiales bacterium]